MVNAMKLNQSKQSFNGPSHHQRVKRVLWQILGVNFLVACAKIIVGLSTSSISMVADGFHSAIDGASNVVGLVGLTIAGQPPDEDHPYGHQKYETFATLGIGLLLLLTSWQVLETVFSRFFEGGTPEVTFMSFAVMIITILFNLAITTYETRQGKRLNSDLLLADAAHTKSDIFVSLSVIVSLVAVQAGWPGIDAAIALIIVFVIGRTGWRIVRRASDVLADSAVIDPQIVEQVVLSVDGVESCHKIRSRGTDQTIYLDLHIQVDGEMSLEQAHQLGHLTQDKLRDELGVDDVLVHVEPR